MTCLQPEMRMFSFGPFVLIPHRQLLAKGRAPVRVGLRCLDILTALVERAGELVTKDELLARAWPNTHVEESNLKVNVAALRRALGDKSAEPQYVVTANGRGYRFIAPVDSRPLDSENTSREAAPWKILPAHATRPIGRDAIVQEVSARLMQYRLVTLAGAGGIGKSTVALSVASHMLERFSWRVAFVDLVSVSDASGVPERVTEALRGCEGSGPVLLITDNCEHVVEAVASVTQDIVHESTHLRILATSREPLGVKGEQVCRLPALDAPLEAAGLTAEEALGYPAIKLFVERAVAGSAYRASDEDVPLLSEVCRRVEGNPLAIELAAARMDSLGLHGLSALMDHPDSMLNLGRRTGPVRHRTLAAAMEWSYQLLSECEQALLRRLSAFMTGFGLDAAIQACEVTLTPRDVARALAGLVAKSLVLLDVDAGGAHFRLSETTRAYAAQKLAEHGEAPALDACDSSLFVGKRAIPK